MSANQRGARYQWVQRYLPQKYNPIAPRFQGSLECVQYATGINVVKEHLNSFEGWTIGSRIFPAYKRAAVKGILFSDNEENFSVKGYPKSRWIVDRTHHGVIMEKGDPFCSVVFPVRNVENGTKKLSKFIKKIKEMNQIQNE